MQIGRAIRRGTESRNRLLYMWELNMIGVACRIIIAQWWWASWVVTRGEKLDPYHIPHTKINSR